MDPFKALIGAMVGCGVFVLVVAAFIIVPFVGIIFSVLRGLAG